MAVNTNDVADAALAAIDAEPAFNTGAHVGESMSDYRRRLKRAEWAAAWGVIETQARVTVNTTVNVPSVSGVTPGVGTSGPGAGTGSTTQGTIT